MKLFMCLIFSFTLLTSVFAQLSPQSIPEFLSPLGVSGLKVEHKGLRAFKPSKNTLPNIVLIGFWPPSNDMLREFSPHRSEEEGSWLGENWKGEGYNVYSFFPEFPDEMGIGRGDFQVDYQDVVADLNEVVEKLRPVAILSFGRAYPNRDWEIEEVTRNGSSWYNDYQIPFLPNRTPPDATLDIDDSRPLIFPAQSVVEAITKRVPELNPFVDDQGAGQFVCEYLGFHLTWYQFLYPEMIRYAAHTHVGSDSSLESLKEALKITLSTLIDELNTPATK